jgi:hypothetical protein
VRKTIAVLGSALFFAVAPTSVAGLVPCANVAFGRHGFGTIFTGERATYVRLGVARVLPRCAPAAS